MFGRHLENFENSGLTFLKREEIMTFRAATGLLLFLCISLSLFAGCTTTKTSDPGTFGHSLRVNGQFMPKEGDISIFPDQIGIRVYTSFNRRFFRILEKEGKTQKIFYWVPTGSSGNLGEDWSSTTEASINLVVENPNIKTYDLVGVIDDWNGRRESMLVKDWFADLGQFTFSVPVIKDKKCKFRIKLVIKDKDVLEGTRDQVVGEIQYDLSAKKGGEKREKNLKNLQRQEAEEIDD